MKNLLTTAIFFSTVLSLFSQSSFNVQDFGEQFFFTPKDQSQIQVCGLEIGAEYDYSITFVRGKRTFKVSGLDGNQIIGNFKFEAKSECKSFDFKVGSDATKADLLEFVIYKVAPASNKQMQFNVQPSNNPRDLISNIFQNNNCFEIIESSIEFSGNIGTYENGDVIGASEGIIMTTGNVNYAEGPNNCRRCKHASLQG